MNLEHFNGQGRTQAMDYSSGKPNPQTAREKPLVEIYTDGACSGNPGPGGWAAILKYGEHRKTLTGGARLTTNNRMEVQAAIEALRALKQPCRVKLYTDSEYLVKAMTEGWVQRWKAQGWMRNKKEPTLNRDLWGALLQLTQQHEVSWIWVRGHADTPDNEACDRLAVEMTRRPDLPPDEGYEQTAKPKSLFA